MKIETKISRSLGLFFYMTCTALTADCWPKADSNSPNMTNKFAQLETLISDYNVNNLFVENDFVKDKEQFNLVRRAYSTADDMLEFNDNPILELRYRKGDKALPLIAFAEHFYYPKAVILLYELAYSDSREKQISPDLREQIRNKFSEAFKLHKIKEDGGRFAALGEIYNLYWKIGYQHLQKAPKTKAPTEAEPGISFSFFGFSSISDFIYKKSQGYEVAGIPQALQISEKKLSKRKSRASESPNEETSSESSLRHRIPARKVQEN